MPYVPPHLSSVSVLVSDVEPRTFQSVDVERSLRFLEEGAMGITTSLETENGRSLGAVEDPTNVLHRILPKAEDRQYQCLNRIDWYGDTIFNYLQASQFLTEWDALPVKRQDAETLRVFDGIRSLAERLRDERHV